MDLINILKDHYNDDPLSTIILIGLFTGSIAILVYLILSIIITI